MSAFMYMYMSMYTHVYHICICIYVYVYIYVYMHRKSTNGTANEAKCSQQVNLGEEYLLLFVNILVGVFL